MKKKYDELDARIVAFIARGSQPFAVIVAECASAAWITSDRPAWYSIQSRLQALRKAGKIEYISGWWQIVDGAK